VRGQKTAVRGQRSAISGEKTAVSRWYSRESVVGSRQFCIRVRPRFPCPSVPIRVRPGFRVHPWFQKQPTAVGRQPVVQSRVGSRQSPVLYPRSSAVSKTADSRRSSAGSFSSRSIRVDPRPSAFIRGLVFRVHPWFQTANFHPRFPHPPQRLRFFLRRLRGAGPRFWGLLEAAWAAARRCRRYRVTNEPTVTTAMRV